MKLFPVLAARPSCRLVYANRNGNDDDREAGYKHLLFTVRQRLTRSCVIPAAPRPSLSFSLSVSIVSCRTVSGTHAGRYRTMCVDVYIRVRVTLIIKRRIITACTRTEHRVYGTYLLHNNVPPRRWTNDSGVHTMRVHECVCRRGVGRTLVHREYRCWIYGRASDSTPTPVPFAPGFLRAKSFDSRLLR